MSRILNSIPLLYVLMLLPGRLSILDMFDASWYYPQMMRESGELSVWYLIASLAVTPTLLLISRIGYGKKFGIWLLRRRKHMGLVSFFFAMVHLVHYVREIADLPSIWIEALELELTVGWVALIIMLALALTSNRASTRKMGKSWKTLHRFVYVAAAMTFLHWYLVDQFIQELTLCAVVLTAVKLVHVGFKTLPAKLRTQ
ncbi:MAG: ferric reductase-like transmembrane domain-containing protein [Litoreibacter sp.]|uniref:ferric reductase-like transmembrane domain-containing protein n=1 Tax=Litoreibacter sp. TaxID=1969459 RepID=UPI0032984455